RAEACLTFSRRAGEDAGRRTRAGAGAARGRRARLDAGRARRHGRGRGMSRRVVVVGSGIAGLSAAFAARKAKATVTMVLGRPGATTLTSGALDDIEWERAKSSPASALAANERAFL